MVNGELHHFPVNEVESRIQLYRVSLERWQGGYSIDRLDRSNYLVIFILNGAGVYWCGDRTCSVGPGYVVSFAPGQPHGLRSSLEDPLTLYRVTLVGVDTAALFQQAFPRISTATLLAEPDRIASLFAQMLREADEARPFHRELLEQSIPVLLTTIRQGVQAQRMPTRAQELWLRAKALMDARFADGITVADIALHCACSPEHLSRTCRRLCMPTPLEYLTKLRMNRAAQLLRLDQSKLAVVAEQCGYANEYAFSKAFKRYFGRSPGAWRDDN